MVTLVALVLAGVLAFVVAERAGTSRLSSAQAARGLEHRLSDRRSARALGLGHPIEDRYTCFADRGAAVPGEPDWTYECTDAVHSQESGFFVLAKGNRIAAIQPSG